ncbi:uncharacterized protein LOC135493401 isoform X2 [Lineus longissimus]|uniref:uncharacterized protein LOC135493401 isoform X2 n=1 Tax=Lineus longissimus TaxID=88925 RepID=UPI00315D49ED
MQRRKILEMTRDRLRETAALEASLPFIDSEDHNTGLVALLTVAYLADEKQSEKFMATKKGPVESLVHRMEEAVRSDNKRDSEAWTATELMKGLGRLALNDANKSLIAECGAIPVLIIQARQDDTPSEQLDSMEVLWTLTFDKKLQTTGIFNEGLELFNRLAGTTDNHICKEAAKGILWNLQGMDMPVSEIKEGEGRAAFAGWSKKFGMVVEDALEATAPYIMISYQWDSQELILKIKDALESHGYNVWIDLEKMAGSILEAMADAVEGACIVLICCSKKYKDSQNCRAEAEYTYKKKKEFIPLIVENRYSADGWLGIMLGTKMYYNFTRSDGFEDKFKELTRALGNKGKISVAKKDSDRVPCPHIVPEKATVTHLSPPMPAQRERSATPAADSEASPSHQGQTSALEHPVGQPSSHGTSLSENVTITLTSADLVAILSKRQSSSDVKNWDADRVRIWMDQHNMDKGKLGHLTGPHLHFLRRMKEDAPPVYYKCMKENLHLIDIDQMAALTNALEEL